MSPYLSGSGPVSSTLHKCLEWESIVAWDTQWRHTLARYLEYQLPQWAGHGCAPKEAGFAVVEAALPHLPEVVADMVRLQRLIGRPRPAASPPGSLPWPQRLPLRLGGELFGVSRWPKSGLVFLAQRVNMKDVTVLRWALARMPKSRREGPFEPEGEGRKTLWQNDLCYVVFFSGGTGRRIPSPKSFYFNGLREVDRGTQRFPGRYTPGTWPPTRGDVPGGAMV